MPTFTDASNVMHQTGPNVYRSESGFTARLEDGLTPHGNPVGRRWVLRDALGAWVDVHQYRHDLFEHNSLRTSY